MPRGKRGRRRTRAPKRAAQRLAEMRSLLLDIEAPLRDAMHYVQAMHFIGSGLVAEDDDAGEPVAAVAHAAAERLETVKEIWSRIHERGRMTSTARSSRRA
ncbi:MAG: hypothetical protein WCE79_05720 [Xanthobacteraceae bacterium]